MKKKHKKKYLFKEISNPYRESVSDSLSLIYERYITDPNSTYEEDGLTFFKVIESYEFFEGVSLLTLDSQLKLQIGDILIDENGNRHVVSAFGMLNMRQFNFPDWYLKITHVQINSDPRTIGTYVARLKENVL